MRQGYRRILAHHLILSGYGFWLANDPRGSGSVEVREGKFADLGEVHRGRRRVQPTREELKAFYEEATPRLEFAPVWFGKEMRGRIGEILSEVAGRRGYTVWACSVGSNHVHLCVRVHRDSYQEMWGHLTGQVRTSLAAEGFVKEGHPVWAERPYSVYLHSCEDIRRTIGYVEGNPEKEGLARQVWGFVRRYEG
jgi:REP element-mobilizing transposase RayT